VGAEPVVRAPQALPDIHQIGAMGLVTEIGDVGRFARLAL
jgi:hypothetical protein